MFHFTILTFNATNMSNNRMTNLLDVHILLLFKDMQ